VKISAGIKQFSQDIFFYLNPNCMGKVGFPNPTSKKNHNGLNEVPPGLLATAIPAERANLLESPSRKLSKL
jgi:hypothetical protein